MSHHPHFSALLVLGFESTSTSGISPNLRQELYFDEDPQGQIVDENIIYIKQCCASGQPLEAGLSNILHLGPLQNMASRTVQPKTRRVPRELGRNAAEGIFERDIQPKLSEFCYVVTKQFIHIVQLFWIAIRVNTADVVAGSAHSKSW